MSPKNKKIYQSNLQSAMNNSKHLNDKQAA